MYQAIGVVLRCIQKGYMRLIDPRVEQFEYASPRRRGGKGGRVVFRTGRVAAKLLVML